MAYQEKIVPTDPAPISEPTDVLQFDRTSESLEQENVWLKEKLARIKGANPSTLHGI
jgi:hypothetical protein